MKWLSKQSIDALGNGLIKNYIGKQADNEIIVDIEGFATDYLKLPVVYCSFAEDDTSKLGFISDGITPLSIIDKKRKIRKVFPKGTIVIEKCLWNETDSGRRRFTIAHEVSHYIMDKSIAAASFHREFDRMQQYSGEDLKVLFNINEANVDRLAAALLLPEFMVKNYLKKHNCEKGISVYDDNFIRPEDNLFIQQMANDMGSSFSALQIRLRQLGLYVKKPMCEYLAELGFGKEEMRCE